MNPDDFSSAAPGRVVRTPTGYWAFIPNHFPIIEWSLSLISAQVEAERYLVGAAWNTCLTKHHSRPFIRREAVLSSRSKAHASLVTCISESAQSSFRKYFDARVHNYVRAGLWPGRTKTPPVSLRLIGSARGSDGRCAGNTSSGQFRPARIDRTGQHYRVHIVPRRSMRCFTLSML
jgi:hypothetical protein